MFIYSDPTDPTYYHINQNFYVGDLDSDFAAAAAIQKNK